MKNRLHHWAVGKFFFIFVITTVSSGCVTTLPSPINGITSGGESEAENFIPISSVISELKRQVQLAYTHVPYIKKRHRDNQAAKGLNPQTGTGTFGGSTQIVRTNSGNVLAIIPFTGYEGSTLSPNFGISSTATSIQGTTLLFSVSPVFAKESASFSSWSNIDLESIDASLAPTVDETDTLTLMLVTAFEEIASTPDMPGDQPYLVDAALTNRELNFELGFRVVRKNEGGLGVKLVPSGPDVDSISSAPALGGSDSRTGNYSLTLKIPLVTPQPSDPKRLLHGTIGSANVLIIDRPYTTDWWNKLSSAGPSFPAKVDLFSPNGSGREFELDAGPSTDNGTTTPVVEPEFSY